MSFESKQRNLGENLGGVIFGCTKDTKDECLADNVFGLPGPHWCYVQCIKKGMPVFLFNYSNKEIYGIFQAVSDGQMHIKPGGWCKGTEKKTPFPAQVRVQVYNQCPPLHLRELQSLVQGCVQPNGYLWFELSKGEAAEVCRAFHRKTEGGSIRIPEQSSQGGRVLEHATPARCKSPDPPQAGTSASGPTWAQKWSQRAGGGGFTKEARKRRDYDAAGKRAMPDDPFGEDLVLDQLQAPMTPEQKAGPAKMSQARQLPQDLPTSSLLLPPVILNGLKEQSKGNALQPHSARKARPANPSMQETATATIAAWKAQSTLTRGADDEVSVAASSSSGMEEPNSNRMSKSSKQGTRRAVSQVHWTKNLVTKVLEQPQMKVGEAEKERHPCTPAQEGSQTARFGVPGLKAAKKEVLSVEEEPSLVQCSNMPLQAADRISPQPGGIDAAERDFLLEEILFGAEPSAAEAGKDDAYPAQEPLNEVLSILLGNPIA